jgi:hypothetical protein
MAAILTDRNGAHTIAGRIRRLIARHDNGDVTVAAKRLSRPIADVYYPERLIACGDGPTAVEFLAEVVRSYETDVVWLITGTVGSSEQISTEARVTIVEVLDELSEHLLFEARESNGSRGGGMQQSNAASRPPRQAPCPSRGSPCRRTRPIR